MSSGAYKKHCPEIYQNLEYPRGICPVADKLQPKIMQFVTNYGSVNEASKYVEALVKTINFYN